MKYRFLPLALLVLAGCEVLTGPDLRAKAQQDVALARADERSLTITPDSAGTTVPSGTLVVKDGFSIDIEGTAQPESVLVGWKQTGGSGTVVFTPLSTTKMNVKVSDGDATVAPVYATRPAVLYILPGGNSVAKNVSVRIVFNQAIDLSGGDIGTYVSLKDQSSNEVAFSNNSTTGSNTIVLKPTTGLSNYGTYIITAKTGIPLLVDFDSDFYEGVTFMNQVVASRNQVANSFTTGNQNDNIPPASASFQIASVDGDTFYTGSDEVVLTDIKADDDSGPGGVDFFAGFNSTGAALAASAGDYSNPFTYGMSSSWALGGTTEGLYSVYLLFRDLSGNLQTHDSGNPLNTPQDSIYMDRTAPSVSAPTLSAGTGTTVAGGYINGLSSTVTLTASDPDIVLGTIKGSGQSTNGTNSVERKLYRLSNDAGLTWSSWTAYPASSTVAWSLASSGGEGARTVSVQVADSVGNVSSTSTSATIQVDTKAPSVSVVPSVAATVYTKILTPTLTLGAIDNGSGVSTYQLTNPVDARPPGLATPMASPAAYTSTPPITLDGSVGDNAFDIKVRDLVGNTRTIPVNFYYDATNPTYTVAASPFSVPMPTALSTFNVTVAGSDAASGMASVRWQINDGAPVLGSATTVAVTGNGSYTFPVAWTPASGNEPSKNLHLWFVDKSGNIAGPETRPFAYNSSAPNGSLTISGSAAPLKGPLSVSWTGTTTAGNVQSFELSNNGTNWVNVNASSTPLDSNSESGSIGTWDPTSVSSGGTSTNGARTVYLRITGTSGASAIRTASYTFDNSPPYLDYYTVSGSGGTAATNTAALTVSFWLYDNITPYSGSPTNTYEFSSDGVSWSAPVSETTYANSVTVTLGTGGLAAPVSGSNYTLHIRGKDQAQNETKTSATIMFDTTAPTPGALSNVPATTGDRVVNVTNNASDSASGLSQVQYWVSGQYSGWMTYTATMPVLLTPINGAKQIQVQYKDVAGNVSGWTTYGAATVTLNSNYANLQTRANIVGANYINPSNRGAIESLTHITGTGVNLTTGQQGPRAYVYITNLGQVGWFDYYLSGTTISFYYQTFNSSGTAVSSPWTSGSISLPTSGNTAYLNLDAATWSAPVYSTFQGSLSNFDLYFYNSGGTLYVYRNVSTGTAPTFSLF